MGVITGVDCFCLPCCYTGCCPCPNNFTGLLATFDGGPFCPEIDGEEMILAYEDDGGKATWVLLSHDLDCGDNWGLTLRCTKEGATEKGDCTDYEMQADVVGSGDFCFWTQTANTESPSGACTCTPLDVRFCFNFSGYEGCGCCDSAELDIDICIDITEIP